VSCSITKWNIHPLDVARIQAFNLIG